MEELFIKAQNEYKTKSQGNIYDGYVIKEYKYLFEREKLFDDKVSIMLPIVFEEMPLVAARIKYPSENRPQFIKTDPSGEVNFGFTYYNEPLEKEQVYSGMMQMIGAVKRVNPAFKFYEHKLENLENDGVVGWYDFKSYAIDDTMYNITIISSIDSKFFFGTLNCRFRDMELWKPAMVEMVKSLRDETKKGD